MQPDTLAIQMELDTVLASRSFRSRRVLCAFLHYTVTQTLAGKAANISQYNIAVEALGKPATFDSNTEPLVRVQAGRLRKQLEDYYATEGRFNTLRITFPNGHYRPVFTPNDAALTSTLVAQDTVAPSLSQGPGIVCVPRTFTQDEAHGWLFITRLSRDYSSVLTRFSFCQVMFADDSLGRKTDWPNDAWQKYGADFALFMDLHSDRGGYHLKCSLVHSQTGQILWGYGFPLGENYPEPAALNPIFKRIAHDTVGAEKGIAQNFWVRRLLASGRPIAPHHQVIVACLQYAWDISRETFRTSLRACEQRLEAFPHDVQALILYADLCRGDYLLKYHEITPLYARTAHAVDTLLQLAPGNAYSHLFQAMSSLFMEEYDECRAALERAQAINPLDTHLNILTGLMYMALGEWQTGVGFIQDSIKISPIYPDWYHIPLCIYHYLEGHYLAAMQEAKKVKLKHLWAPMLRAALHQLNNQHERGTLEYQRLTNDYADFAHTSQKLTQGFTPQANSVFQRLWSHVPRDQQHKTDKNTTDGS